MTLVKEMTIFDRTSSEVLSKELVFGSLNTVPVSLYLAKLIMNNECLVDTPRIEGKHLDVIDLVLDYLFTDDTNITNITIDKLSSHSTISRLLQQGKLTDAVLVEIINYFVAYECSSPEDYLAGVKHINFGKFVDVLYADAYDSYVKSEQELLINLNKVKDLLEDNHKSRLIRLGIPSNSISWDDVCEVSSTLWKVLNLKTSSVTGNGYHSSMFLHKLQVLGIITESYAINIYMLLQSINAGRHSLLVNDILEISEVLYKLNNLIYSCTFLHNLGPYKKQSEKDYTVDWMGITAIKNMLQFERAGFMSREDVNILLTKFNEEGRLLPRHFEVLSQEDIARLSEIIL